MSGPLYYVAVSQTSESPKIIQKQLALLHKTVISTLTATQLE
jgi:hypothetical protein